MSKVLISCASLGSGGAERVISVLSKTLADNFDDVLIVMWLKHPIFYKVDERVRLVLLPDISGTSNRYAEIFSFKKVVNREKPDLILSFLTPFNVLVEVATWGMSIPVVVCERTDPDRTKGFAKIIRNIAYRKASGILTQTFASKESFKGVLYDKTSVIYNPVIMNCNAVGSALNASKENIIVTAGRLIPIKNQKMMVDAFKIVKMKHCDYKLVMYGEGSYRDTLQTYINTEGLSESVYLPGNRKDVWEYLKTARVFLLTSYFEGMPNAMLEAMCLGLPCISTKIKAATELIVEGENGYLVDFDDSKSLAKKICFLIENPDTSMSIGKKSVEIYRELREDVISEQWVSYIKNIINNSY